tara:strand:+ start:4824 stop:6038 length:1215 start_codon:yes stop_codon:yes gene_type:complete
MADKGKNENLRKAVRSVDNPLMPVPGEVDYYMREEEEAKGKPTVAEQYGEIKVPAQEKRLRESVARTALVPAPSIDDPLNRNLIGVGLTELATDSIAGKVLGAGLGLVGKMGKGVPLDDVMTTKKAATKADTPASLAAEEEEFFKRHAATQGGKSQWFTNNEVVEETPEFKNFSKGLRVRDAGTPDLIDDEGAVIRAFHGTGGKIIGGEFWVDSELGAHFGTPAAANARIKYLRDVSHDMPQSFGRMIDDPTHGGMTYPVYLRMEKPYRMEDLGDWNPSKVVKELTEDPDLDFTKWPNGAEGLVDDVKVGGDFEPIQEFLKRNGHDGVVYVNRIEDKGADSYIVFDPRQVKSITGNVGNFDPMDPDMSYAAVLGGAATAEAARRSMSGEAESKPRGVDNPHGGK